MPSGEAVPGVPAVSFLLFLSSLSSTPLSSPGSRAERRRPSEQVRPSPLQGPGVGRPLPALSRPSAPPEVVFRRLGAGERKRRHPALQPSAKLDIPTQPIIWLLPSSSGAAHTSARPLTVPATVRAQEGLRWRGDGEGAGKAEQPRSPMCPLDSLGARAFQLKTQTPVRRGDGLFQGRFYRPWSSGRAPQGCVINPEVQRSRLLLLCAPRVRPP